MMQNKGRQVANLLGQFHEGISLNDKFMSELLSGLRFLESFNRGMGFSPETVYYASLADQIERMLENRRVSQRKVCNTAKTST